MIAIVGSLDARHGRGRPVSAARYDEIQEVAARYPDALLGGRCRRCSSRRSATAGCSPEAFREVADALDLTPAYCHVGRVVLRHVPPRAGRASTWSRSARTSRAALVGAQQVVEAFESELGVARRRDDRGRRDHAAHGRVPRRLRLGDGRRGRQPPPPARAAPRTCRRSSRSCAVAAGRWRDA